MEQPNSDDPRNLSADNPPPAPPAPPTLPPSRFGAGYSVGQLPNGPAGAQPNMSSSQPTDPHADYRRQAAHHFGVSKQRTASGNSPTLGPMRPIKPNSVSLEKPANLATPPPATEQRQQAWQPDNSPAGLPRATPYPQRQSPDIVTLVKWTVLIGGAMMAAFVWLLLARWFLSEVLFSAFGVILIVLALATGFGYLLYRNENRQSAQRFELTIQQTSKRTLDRTIEVIRSTANSADPPGNAPLTRPTGHVGAASWALMATGSPPPVRSSSGATAISSAVLSLLGGAANLLFPVSVLWGAATIPSLGVQVPSSFYVYTIGPALALIAVAVALIIGGVLLLRRNLAARVIIVVACVATVIVNLFGIYFVYVTAHMMASGLSDLIGSPVDSAYDPAMSILSSAPGLIFPIVTAILALTPSTRRWCLAGRGRTARSAR